MDTTTGKEDNQVRTVSIHSFIAARAKELKALSSRASGSTDPSKIPFKHIPKHLRRRAVSHNVKRLPFRFRPKQDSAVHGSRGDPLSFISDKKKIKSRKSRRRKSNLLMLYNNRQRVTKWLETHIWHAKRFRMENKWNYKIPIAPCNKGKRPMYRSVKSYTTMQDVSYYCSFELSGPLETLRLGLNSMLPEASNLERIDKVLYLSGEREGTFHLYHRDSYPYGYIGEMKAIWLKTAKENGIASIWISVHPAIKDEFAQECTRVFQLERGYLPVDIQNDKILDQIVERTKEDDKSASIDVIKLAPKQTEFWGTYWTNDEKKLRMDLIEGQLNRIRLCGPESFGVLKQILQPTALGILEGRAGSDKKTWLEDFPVAKLVKNKPWTNSELLEVQSLVWELLSDISDVPFGAVIPLIVRDPRVFLPRTRSKIQIADKTEDMNEEEDDDQILSTDVVDKMAVHPAEDSKIIKSTIPVKDDTFSDMFSTFLRCTCSPLEDTTFRQDFVTQRMSDQEFCRRRAGLLIPGTEIDLGKDENQIPVILIHRHPSSNAKNLTDSGFDLIVPAAWAVSFWVALAYRCARAAGLRDSIDVAYQARNLHSSLFIPPDSKAGREEASIQQEANREKYFSYPPAKRQNLVKLNCVSPFGNNWSGLLNFCRNSEKMDTEETSSSRFYVLRDASLLKLLAANLQTHFWRKLVENLKTISDLDECLIGCRLEVNGRGTIEDRAVICLPTEEDLFLLADKNNPLKSGPKTHEEPSKKEVDYEKQRKVLRDKHVKLMEFLRRRRKRIRENFKNRITSTSTRKDLLFFKTDCDAQLKQYDSKLLSKLYNEKINNFWLIPNEEFSVGLKSSTRSPIGFTIYGGNDYSRGRCSALAYITARGLLDLAEHGLSNKKLGKLVLARNWTNTYVYAHAKLDILIL